jgi:superoxide reductase
MTKINEFYKCDICGNVVSVIEDGMGHLVCCGKGMDLLEEKTQMDEGKEKHVPIIESFDGGLRVKVGSMDHPMEENHYIELIQIIKDGVIIGGKRLKPGDKPVAEFCYVNADGVTARALCNVHGLWKNK